MLIDHQDSFRHAVYYFFRDNEYRVAEVKVSREEMEDILEGTNWYLKESIESNGPRYIAIIEKKKE